MEPCKRSTARPRLSHRGAGRQGIIFSFRSREKNVLDFSSYRSRFFANLLLRRWLTCLRFSDKAGNHNLSSVNGYDIVGNDLRSTDDLVRSEVVPSGTQRREG